MIDYYDQIKGPRNCNCPFKKSDFIPLGASRYGADPNHNYLYRTNSGEDLLVACMLARTCTFTFILLKPVLGARTVICTFQFLPRTCAMKSRLQLFQFAAFGVLYGFFF
jgi:hypothetical protein